MLDKLKALGDLKKVRDQAMAIQKKLAQIEVEVEEEGIAVVVTGDQKIKSLKVEGEEKERVRKVINEALKNAQEKAAQEMGRIVGQPFGCGV